MVDLNKLSRPKRSANLEQNQEVESSGSEEAKTVGPTIAVTPDNLMKPTRGTKVAKQFRLDPDIVCEFETTARERGYRQRQDSAFFVEVWTFFKENINKV